MNVHRKRITVILIVGILLCFFAFVIINHQKDSSNNVSIETSDNYPVYSKVDITLKSGRYYLNGNSNSCYFSVQPNKIQLCGEKSQFIEMVTQMYYSDIKQNPEAFNDDFISETADQELKDWAEYKDYIIRSIEDKILIIYSWSGDDNEEIYITNAMDYIDENTLDYAGLMFYYSNI